MCERECGDQFFWNRKTKSTILSFGVANYNLMYCLCTNTFERVATFSRAIEFTIHMYTYI